MRTTLILATVVAIVLATFAAIDLQAQQRSTAPAVGGHVAVLDVGYVFKNHTRFKQSMDRMKGDVEAAEAELKKEHARITSLQEKLKSFKPGTQEFKGLEEEVTKLKAAFQVRASLQQKEFLERESKLYYTAYQDVSETVKYYADRNGIGLVLRFNGDPVDPNSRESVLATINRPVVYQRGVDITPIILDEVNRNNPSGAGAAGVRKPATTR